MEFLDLVYCLFLCELGMALVQPVPSEAPCSPYYTLLLFVHVCKQNFRKTLLTCELLTLFQAKELV